MKRACSGPLFNPKKINQGNDRLVPDIDPVVPSTSTEEIKHVKHGAPVDRFSVKKAGKYSLIKLWGNERKLVVMI